MKRDTCPNRLTRLLLVLALVMALAAGRVVVKAYAEASSTKPGTDELANSPCCETTDAEGEPNLCCEPHSDDGRTDLCCSRKLVKPAAAQFSETPWPGLKKGAR